MCIIYVCVSVCVCEREREREREVCVCVCFEVFFYIVDITSILLFTFHQCCLLLLWNAINCIKWKDIVYVFTCVSNNSIPQTLLILLFYCLAYNVPGMLLFFCFMYCLNDQESTCLYKYNAKYIFKTRYIWCERERA